MRKPVIRWMLVYMPFLEIIFRRKDRERGEIERGGEKD